MSSKLWPLASKSKPCLVCGKPDWCSFGDKAMKCQRVQSNFPCRGGGWLHFYEAIGSHPVSLPARKAPPRINPGIANGFKERDVDGLAKELGVSPQSLNALDIAWSPKDSAWTFPMRDGDGEIVGYRTRHMDGQKKAITGSRQGLFIPNADVEIQNSVFICEGPTDTAAALTLGFYAIGKPSCNCGDDMIKVALKRLKIFKVVIVTDNDEIKSSGKRPGLEGALKLRKELGMSAIMWMPPGNVKDIREYLKKGGTQKMILSDLGRKVWGKS